MPIRLRLALSFALVTLVLFGVGGLLFERSFRHGVPTSLDPGLQTHAQTLGREVLARGASVDLRGGVNTGGFGTRDAVAQILDADGRVLTATDEAGPKPLISRSRARQARDGNVFADVRVGGEHERYRVLAGPVAGTHDRLALVGTSLESADEAVTRVRTALVAGVPLAAVLAGGGAWLLASAALRPVERMRREAALISEHEASSRLQVPSTRDEIAALGSTMNALLERLQGALIRQRAFVADAGHELRTPLGVLQTELELAGRPRRSREELRDAIEHAADETQRLARLAEALLFLAASDDRRVHLRAEPTPIAPLLERAALAIRARATPRDVTVETDCPPNISAPLDADLIRTALDNLLENALRYAPAGSTITLRARRDAGQIVIEVADTGPGFPPEFLPHAFERFRRADEGRARSAGGAGVGLSIVQAVAGAHGGDVDATNRPEGGAAVTLRLPADVRTLTS